MHLRGILVLVLLVGGLGAVLHFTKDEGRAADGAIDLALFEGVSTDRVRTVRIENLERGYVVRLERDAAGVWSITDPIAYRADAGVVQAILDTVRAARGLEVPDADPAELGLDPPLAVVRVVEQVGEDERRTEVAVGRPTLDPNVAYYLVDDRVVRAPRSLSTALDRHVEEYRHGRLPCVPARDVIAFERSGALPVAEQPLEGGGWAAPDLALAAELSADGWRATRPWEAQLDIEFVSTMLGATLLMRVRGFASDHPAATTSAEYGLDDPALVLTVRTAAGGSQVLRFGSPASTAADPPDSRRWYATVDDEPHVFEVDYRGPWLASQSADTLVDTRLVRAVLGDVARLTVTREDATVELTRPGEFWLLAKDGRLVRADEGGVSDLLSRLQQLTTSTLVPDAAWPEAGARVRYELETGDGRVQAATIGPVETLDEGGEFALYRRDGDAVSSRVDPALVELLSVDPASLRSRTVAEQSENETVRISLRRGEDEARTWIRDGQGRWCPEGTPGIEDRAFARVVDRLLSVRVTGWDPAADALEDALEVTLAHHVSGDLVYRLGTAGDRELAELDGERGDVTPGLVEAISALLD